jgi:hypothetical protein
VKIREIRGCGFRFPVKNGGALFSMPESFVESVTITLIWTEPGSGTPRLTYKFQVEFNSNKYRGV